VYLRGYGLAGVQVVQADGTRTTPQAAEQILTAVQAGASVVDGNGNQLQPFEAANPNGGYLWLFNGCPASVLVGANMTMAEAQTIVKNQVTLSARGWTGCLATAQAMVGTPAPPPAPGPLNPPLRQPGITPPPVLNPTPGPIMTTPAGPLVYPPTPIVGTSVDPGPAAGLNPLWIALAAVGAYLLARK
jgi:hypothetical protein